MNPRAFTLLEALKAGAQHGGEIRLYARGKVPGLFAKRTRLNAKVASQAIQDGLLEVTRVEPVGKATVEWVRVTPRGLNFLLESESPARALAELRDALAVHDQGLPLWIAQLHARLDDLARRFNDELAQIRQWLQQIAELTLKEFHAGLKRLRERQWIALLPGSSDGDAPAPEYAMLDGAGVCYYVRRTKGPPRIGEELC
ncbi:MAG: hypothetical protein HYR84_14645 [Planctomycetes bacterium]|nr:hypothetical protein [Planctomycetota bacterium]